MRYLLNRIQDLIYPRRCAFCDRPLRKDETGACEDCKKKLCYIPEPVCLCCGKPVMRGEEKCLDCKEKNHIFTAGRFPLSYEFAREGIYRFKYNNRKEYGAFYAASIMERWGEWLKGLHPEALIPVPLHEKKLRKRGYNQAEILSRELSKLLLVPTDNSVVKRVRNTIPQKLFSRKQRQINMKKAFIVSENSVKYEKVLVVDDIFTTGSTIDSISRELKLSGVREVYFITATGAGT